MDEMDEMDDDPVKHPHTHNPYKAGSYFGSSLEMRDDGRPTADHIEMCKHALYNWGFHVLTGTSGSEKFATPVDAVKAWQTALDFWEAKAREADVYLHPSNMP